jgi:predicted GNAT family acetyltransferase
MEIKIQLEESSTKGSFFVSEKNKRLAEMTFSKSVGRIIIDHTDVSDALRGKNVGKQLVAAAVEYARKNNIKILPLCPFAKSVFNKVVEFQDVLDV